MTFVERPSSRSRIVVVTTALSDCLNVRQNIRRRIYTDAADQITAKVRRLHCRPIVRTAVFIARSRFICYCSSCFCCLVYVFQHGALWERVRWASYYRRSRWFVSTSKGGRPTATKIWILANNVGGQYSARCALPTGIFIRWPHQPGSTVRACIYVERVRRSRKQATETLRTACKHCSVTPSL